MMKTVKAPLNLVILCPDELRADCLGYAGNPDIRTPHIDTLAEASVIFPNHCATFPKCVPARMTLTTGRYSHADGGRTIFQRLPTGTPNVLSRLRSADYQTALFGKNHCWSAADREAGFDFCSKCPPYQDSSIAAPKMRACRERTGQADPKLDSGYDYIGSSTRHAGDEAFLEQACDFLKNRRDQGRPFFMQLNFESPHPVYGVEEPWFSMYDRRQIRAWPHALPRNAPEALLRQREIRTSAVADEAALREIQAVYYGMVSKVDAQIGEIVHCLKRQGLWENTIIVFLSDHGDYAGQYGLVEKWDTSLCDCLVRTPLLVRAPGLPEGVRVDSLSDHSSIAATLLELLELEPLPSAHGQSLVPVANGEKRIDFAFAEGGHEKEMRERFDVSKASPAGMLDPSRPLNAKQKVYLEYPDTMAKAAMVRSDRWKLVVRETGDHEFYDLRDDPWELDNLWHGSLFEEEKRTLLLELARWQLTTTGDRPYEDNFGA